MQIKLMVLLILFIYGCDRGVGKEPIAVKQVSDDNLIGTWVLSKKYTNQKIIERLDKNIEDYYFKLLPNNLEYHSFDEVIGFSKPKFLDDNNGKWKLVNNRLILEKNSIYSTYIDAKGIYYRDENHPNITKPIKKRISKVIVEFKRLRITKKNNELILWCYRGDPDARRYIMYEKKAIESYK